jgi:hypothetical protein
MALMAGEWGAVVCLGIVCIMMVMTAGCSYAMYTSGDMTEEDCLRVSGIDRDHCYKNLAVSRGNSTLCGKIEDPGPKSKCYLELGECGRLSFQATGDGAYTKYDCYQYKAIQDRSVRLCEEYLDVYVSWNRNDLNPTGVSKETCIKRVTEKCGHIGQNACFDYYYKKDYCVEGWIGSGKCVPDS